MCRIDHHRVWPSRCCLALPFYAAHLYHRITPYPLQPSAGWHTGEGAMLGKGVCVSINAKSLWRTGRGPRGKSRKHNRKTGSGFMSRLSLSRSLACSLSLPCHPNGADALSLGRFASTQEWRSTARGFCLLFFSLFLALCFMPVRLFPPGFSRFARLSIHSVRLLRSPILEQLNPSLNSSHPWRTTASRRGPPKKSAFDN